MKQGDPSGDRILRQGWSAVESEPTIPNSRTLRPCRLLCSLLVLPSTFLGQTEPTKTTKEFGILMGDADLSIENISPYDCPNCFEHDRPAPVLRDV